MHVIGYNARLLRDTAGNNMDYFSNSITLGWRRVSRRDPGCQPAQAGWHSLRAGEVYYLYTPNLDHLSNDAENFGGLMTEVHICTSVNPASKACN